MIDEEKSNYWRLIFGFLIWIFLELIFFHLALTAYVYFSGQTKGHVRFVEENAAVELAAKMKEKLAESEKLKVKEADISFR